jgi:deazaflavin-dependent oxidoreductase (nitroreductase family)
MPTPPIPVRGSVQEKIWFRFTGLHTRLYRLSGGRIGRTFAKAPIVLLDHVGRKSGQKRTTPLIYLDDEPNLVVVASYGGAVKDPAWWLNLQAAPVTSVRLGAEDRRVRAREATAEERERLWPAVVGIYPDYAVYAERTERQIPLVVLEPA